MRGICLANRDLVRRFILKRKTRTITIDNQQYIWWYELGAETTINLSPINDKTSIISIYFPLDTIHKHEHPIFDIYNETVIMKKDNEEYCLKIISPKMVALIISNLSFNEFTTRRHVFYNGFDLLLKWNYIISDVVTGVCW